MSACVATMDVGFQLLEGRVSAINRRSRWAGVRPSLSATLPRMADLIYTNARNTQLYLAYSLNCYIELAGSRL